MQVCAPYEEVSSPSVLNSEIGSKGGGGGQTPTSKCTKESYRRCTQESHQELGS